jgi:hypothetical protein
MISNISEEHYLHVRSQNVLKMEHNFLTKRWHAPAQDYVITKQSITKVLNIIFLNARNSSLKARDRVSHPYKTTGKTIPL